MGKPWNGRLQNSWTASDNKATHRPALYMRKKLAQSKGVTADTVTQIVKNLIQIKEQITMNF